MSLKPPLLSRLQASLILLLVAFIWGTTFVAMKTAFDTVVDGRAAIGVLTLVGIRFLLGALVVLPFARFEQKQKSVSNPLNGRLKALFLLLGLTLAVASFFQQLGVSKTTVTNAGFLTSLYVPLVPLIVYLVFRQSISGLIWMGTIGCVIGSCFLTGAIPQGIDSLNQGDVWVIFSTLFWALHVIGLGFLASHSGRPLTLACVQFVVAGCIGLSLGFVFEDPYLKGILAVWPQILYSGILSVGLAYTLQGVAQRIVSPSATAIILAMEMVFAAAAGAILLDERLVTTQWIGAALILGCLLMVEITAARRRTS